MDKEFVHVFLSLHEAVDGIGHVVEPRPLGVFFRSPCWVKTDAGDGDWFGSRVGDVRDHVCDARVSREEFVGIGFHSGDVFLETRLLRGFLGKFCQEAFGVCDPWVGWCEIHGEGGWSDGTDLLCHVVSVWHVGRSCNREGGRGGSGSEGGGSPDSGVVFQVEVFGDFGEASLREIVRIFDSIVQLIVGVARYLFPSSGRGRHCGSGSLLRSGGCWGYAPRGRSRSLGWGRDPVGVELRDAPVTSFGSLAGSVRSSWLSGGLLIVIVVQLAPVPLRGGCWIHNQCKHLFGFLGAQ